MFDIAKHRQIMITVLKAIYSDPEIHGCLGFKGGTAAYLFYNLPRFSVDLDFDLLDESKKDLILNKLKIILSERGEILEAREKRYTLFFLLRYQFGTRNLKVEISKRKPVKKYSPKSFMGISILVGEKEGALSGKLSAFLTRKVFAARDAFDLWFFLQNNWQIDAADLKDQIGLTPKEAWQKALEKTQKISKRQMLQGLAELIEEKQKTFVREKLLTDLTFYLRLYLDSISDPN